jgi:hypothetical protein
MIGETGMRHLSSRGILQCSSKPLLDKCLTISYGTRAPQLWRVTSHACTNIFFLLPPYVLLVGVMVRAHYSLLPVTLRCGVPMQIAVQDQLGCLVRKKNRLSHCQFYLQWFSRESFAIFISRNYRKIPAHEAERRIHRAGEEIYHTENEDQTREEA